MVRHCIVGLLVAWCTTLAIAQGSRALSLPDARSWEAAQERAEALLSKGDLAGAAAAAGDALRFGTAGFGAGDPNVAASHATLAAVHLRAGRLADAEAGFRRALAIYEERLGPTHEDTGAVLNNLGLVLERQGSLRDAELLLRRALDIKERANGRSHPDTAVTLANLARVLDRQGRGGQLAAAPAGPPRAGTGASATAPSADLPPQRSASEAPYREALAVHLRELGPQHATTVATLANLAGVMMLEGRYTDAEKVYRRVLAAREKSLGPEHADTALAMIQVANALFEDAKREGAIGLSALASGPQSRQRAVGVSNRPVSEIEGLYRRALTALEVAGRADGAEAAATFNNLAVLLAGRARFGDAVPLHARALQIAERTLGSAHLDTAAILTAMAITLDRKGDLVEAERLFARATAIARESGARRNVLVNAGGMAFSLARRGRLREALPWYREAVDALDYLHAHARGADEDARRSFLAQYAGLHGELMRALAMLHAQAPGEGLDREALAVASRGQSRVFSDMLRAAEVARFSTQPEFIARKERRDALQREVAESRVRLLSVADSSSDAQRRKAELARALADAEARLAATDAEMRREHPRYMELAAPRAVGVEDLQKRLLRPGEAALVLVTLPRETLVFAITRDAFRMGVARVGRAELGRRVALLRRPLERMAQGESPLVLRQVDPALLASLYQDLLGPVADVLAGASQVLTVADGPLFALPLELLVTSYDAGIKARFDAARAASDGDAARPFLGEYGMLPFARARHRFTYLPSLSALESQRTSSRPPGRYARELVAFADPVFGPEPGETAQLGEATRRVLGALAARADAAAPIPRLPDTAAEAKSAAELLGEPSLLLVRREAQESRAKSGVLKDARYVLFATHGFLGADFAGSAGEEPGGARGALAQPALALTLTGELGGEDGLLSMREVIEDLTTDAELVVLSACNTASDGDAGLSGEGFAGLTRAFMYAGARRLMVSHWAVDSAATSALVTGVFRILKSGKAPSQALAESQAAISATAFSSGSRSFARAHPYFWAPFVMVGE